MRGSTAALVAAALLMLLLLPALLMLLVSPAADPDTYEQETRRIFAEWKAKHRNRSYKYAGDEECRYALFKESRRRVARAKAAGVTSSGINGLSAHAQEEVLRGGDGFHEGEESYEEETRRMFAGWKAKFGKIYRDVRDEECRYMLFKGNRRIVVQLNAAAGEDAYGLNQFGDLTNEEVCERCNGRGAEEKLSTRCQAATVFYSVHERLIRSQVCRCIAKQTESEGSAIPVDEARMRI